MTVPAFLFAVYGEVYINALRIHPFVDYLMIINEIVFGA